MIEVTKLLKIQNYRDEGLSKTAVAERLGIHRNTVAKYWDCKNESDIKNMQPKGSSSKIKPYINYIIDRLEKYPELTAERLCREIKKKGYKGSARTVRRFVATIRPSKENREYKPYETFEGEQAQVDWGYLGYIRHGDKKIKAYVFAFTLSWSRVRYAEIVTDLGLATFVASLHRAFHYIGGVPKTILFDNAKTVVSERVGSTIQFNSSLSKAALIYGFMPKACWIEDPESKGKVENCVKYIKKDFFYGSEFDSVEDANLQLLEWLNDVANAKIHNTTNEVPWERLKQELAYLKPLPSIEGPMPIVETRKATKTSLISVKNNKYSIPSKLANKTVQVHLFENRFEIYNNNHLEASHTFVDGVNQRVLLDEHYPAHLISKSRKSKLEIEFEELAPEAKEYLTQLPAKCSNLREQMEKIIELKKSYTPEQISVSMGRALTYGAFGYSSLKNILRTMSSCPEVLEARQGNVKLENASYNIGVQKRDLSYYGGVLE